MTWSDDGCKHVDDGMAANLTKFFVTFSLRDNYGLLCLYLFLVEKRFKVIRKELAYFSTEIIAPNIGWFLHLVYIKLTLEDP